VYQQAIPGSCWTSLRTPSPRSSREEIVGQSRIGRTLAVVGEALGYKHKQQIPAGGALVYATVALIAHFMRESLLGGDPGRSLRTLEA
jgi:hypothetical protein